MVSEEETLRASWETFLFIKKESLKSNIKSRADACNRSKINRGHLTESRHYQETPDNKVETRLQ